MGPLEQIGAPEEKIGVIGPLERPGHLNQEQGLFEDHGAPWSETDGALGQETIGPCSK